jgi:hypothetical protein
MARSRLKELAEGDTLPRLLLLLLLLLGDGELARRGASMRPVCV